MPNRYAAVGEYRFDISKRYAAIEYIYYCFIYLRLYAHCGCKCLSPKVLPRSDGHPACTRHQLSYDADGNPILEHSKKHLYAGRVNEIEDFHNQTSGHAHLIHAFNAGYNTVVMHFDAPVSGSYSLKTGEDTVLRSAVEYGPTTELLIYLDAVDINTIKYDDGLKIEITVNQNVNIRNITASQTTGN